MGLDSGCGSVGFGPLPASMSWSLGAIAHAASASRAASAVERSVLIILASMRVVSVSPAAHLDVAMRFEPAAQVLVLALAHLPGALHGAVAYLPDDLVLVLGRRDQGADQRADRHGDASQQDRLLVHDGDH